MERHVCYDRMADAGCLGWGGKQSESWQVVWLREKRLVKVLCKMKCGSVAGVDGKGVKCLNKVVTVLFIG